MTRDEWNNLVSDTKHNSTCHENNLGNTSHHMVSLNNIIRQRPQPKINKVCLCWEENYPQEFIQELFLALMVGMGKELKTNFDKLVDDSTKPPIENSP